MEYQLQTLMRSAGTIGLWHTLKGIDHTLPSVVLGRARNWSLPKALTMTGLCGVGHVLPSVFIGVTGIGLGVAVERLEWIEGARGNLGADCLRLDLRGVGDRSSPTPATSRAPARGRGGARPHARPR